MKKVMGMTAETTGTSGKRWTRLAGVSLAAAALGFGFFFAGCEEQTPGEPDGPTPAELVAQGWGYFEKDTMGKQWVRAMDSVTPNLPGNIQAGNRRLSTDPCLDPTHHIMSARGDGYPLLSDINIQPQASFINRRKALLGIRSSQMGYIQVHMGSARCGHFRPYGPSHNIPGG